MIKLNILRGLEFGWNGYSAAPPNESTIQLAESFLNNLKTLEPDRVKPSAIGGVGITFRCLRRKAYVELSNAGDICVLFSVGEGEPEVKKYDGLNFEEQIVEFFWRGTAH